MQTRRIESCRDLGRYHVQPLEGLEVPTPPGQGADRTEAIHEMVTNGPIEKIKEARDRLEYLYVKNVSITTQRRVTQIKSGLSKGGKLLSSAFHAFNPLLSIFRNSVLSGEKLVKPFQGVAKAVKKTRLFAAASIPVALYAIIAETVGTVVSIEKGKYADAGEHGLFVIDNIGDLSHSVDTFISGLEACEAVVTNPALQAATTSLAIIGTVFSLASIALQSKFIYETNKLKNRMIQVFGSEDNPNFEGVVKLFDRYSKKHSDSRLARCVGVSDGAKLKARMHAVFERNKNFETDEIQEKNLNDTFEALKKRIKWNNIGRYVKIIAAVITIVATIALLCSPGAPAGYALLAIAAAIGIAVLVMDYKMEKDLNNHFKTLAPNNCPEMQSFYNKKKPKELTEGEKNDRMRELAGRKWKKKLEKNPAVRRWDLDYADRVEEEQGSVERHFSSFEYEDIPVKKREKDGQFLDVF